MVKSFSPYADCLITQASSTTVHGMQEVMRETKQKIDLFHLLIRPFVQLKQQVNKKGQKTRKQVTKIILYISIWMIE